MLNRTVGPQRAFGTFLRSGYLIGAAKGIKSSCKSSFYSTQRINVNRPLYRTRLNLGLSVLAGSALTYALLSENKNNSILLDSPLTQQSTTLKLDPNVQPETNVEPFPLELELNGHNYDLLGVGVRTVSFISLHVYALGIYMASEDKQLAAKLLHSIRDSDKAIEGSVMDALMDDVKGQDIISKLLDGGVRLDIRIVPVRNTDFSHLRDGFVRSILGHSKAKEHQKSEESGEEFGEGVNELKKVFGRKRSVPKHKILHLSRGSDGSLSVIYFNGKDETKVEPEILGIVRNKLISEILFLQYLSGSKPSSEGARKAAVEGLAQLEAL